MARGRRARPRSPRGSRPRTNAPGPRSTPDPTAGRGWPASSACSSCPSRRASAWPVTVCSRSSGEAARSSCRSWSGRSTSRPPRRASWSIRPRCRPTRRRPSTGTTRRSTAGSSPTASPRPATSAASCGSSTSRPGKHLGDEIPETRAASVALVAGRHGVPLLPLPGGRPVQPAHLPPPPRRAVGRRRAGVGRPAHARIVGRRGHLARRTVRARHGARRLVPDRPAPPGRAVRRVADAHRGRRRDHLRPLRRIDRLVGRHDARRAPGPGRRHPPRPRRAGRGVDDPRARGRGRHPACRAGRRRRCWSSPPTRPPPASPATTPDGAVVGEVALPELCSVVGLDAGTDRSLAFVQLEGFTRPASLFRWSGGELEAHGEHDRRRRARRRSSPCAQERYPSADGTEIGLFLVHRADEPARRGHALHPDRLRRVRHRRDAGVVADHRRVGRARRAVRRRRAPGRLRGGRGVAPGRPPRAQAAGLRRLPRRRRPPRRRRSAPRGTAWPSGAAPTAGSSSASP